MTLISELGDEELALFAKDWRDRALRGEKAARGTAHALETELRRRGAGSRAHAVPDDLDTRPTSQRERPNPWWRFWAT